MNTPPRGMLGPIGALILAHVRLAHPGPALTVVVVGVGSGLLANQNGLCLRKTALLAATLAGNQYATGALNDVLDAARDAQAKREDKPIVSGAISVHAAAWCTAGAAAVSLLTATRLNRAVVGLDIAWLCCATAYNGWLKPTSWSVVPFVIALPLVPLFGAAAGGRMAATWWWVWPIGITGALAVHLADALPDVESDTASDVRGLAVRLGAQRASLLQAASYLLMIAVTVGSAAPRSVRGSAMLGVWGAGCGYGALRHTRSGPAGRRRAYGFVLAGVAGQALAWITVTRPGSATTAERPRRLE